MAKVIRLTQGYSTIVDDVDFEKLSRYRWKAMQAHGLVYAVRTKMLPGRWASGCRRSKTILMHREILGLKTGDPEVDHKNTNSLDNRRKNLRLATHTQNAANQRKTRGRSKYKGVYWNKEKGLWQAQISAGVVDGKPKVFYLGRFHAQEDAARAYDKKARELHGEFARPRQVKP